jgi:hypothetical protein
MDELIKSVLQSYGLVGVILAAPLVGLVYVWKDNKALQEQVVEAQKQRVADAQQVADKLITMIQEQAGLAKETNIALDRLGNMLSSMLAIAQQAGRK